jgi:hypothetical protein
MQRSDQRYLGLIALLGLTVGALYFIAIDLHDPAFIFTQQQNVIAGGAGSPYRYRVLVPALLELGTRAFAGLGTPQTGFLDASLLYDCLGLAAQFGVLYVWFREFFPPTQSLVGVAFVSGLTVMTLAYFTYQPWSILEVAFFATGFILAHRGRWHWVGVIVVLASLNRETGVFLPLALFLASLDTTSLIDAWRKRETRLSFMYLVVSTAIFAGLRLVRGSADPVDQLQDVIARNFQRNNLIAAGFAVPLFLGLGWIYAVRGFSLAPPCARQLVRVIPFYLAAFAIWGWWREVRILTSVYPILVPLVLSYCYAR